MTNSFHPHGKSKSGRVSPDVENEKRAVEFPPDFATRVFFSESAGLALVFDIPPEINRPERPALLTVSSEDAVAPWNELRMTENQENESNLEGIPRPIGPDFGPSKGKSYQFIEDMSEKIAGRMGEPRHSPGSVRFVYHARPARGQTRAE